MYTSSLCTAACLSVAACVHCLIVISYVRVKSLHISALLYLHDTPILLRFVLAIYKLNYVKDR